MSRRLPEDLRKGIAAAKSGQFLVGLTLLGSFYEDPGNVEKAPDGLSWYGLCVAMIQKNYDQAIECCKVALERQPERATHYLNLARIHLARGKRREAVETADQGLAIHSKDPDLLAFRRQLGVRARPAVPFLERGHAVNVAIGQVRHAVKKKPGTKPSQKK